MEQLRNQLQQLLTLVKPTTQIDKTYSIGGQVYIRFALGEPWDNGTKERVQQATDRAFTISKDLFKTEENIWLLSYEYLEDDFFQPTNEYLYQQINPKYLNSFYNKIEKVSNGFFELGSEEVSDVRVCIGKVSTKEINIERILNAIANLEMGFKPGISQDVYFFNEQANIGFHMYDDRGCDVWSDSSDNLKELYVKRNEWILDYNREEIDQQFR